MRWAHFSLLTMLLCTTGSVAASPNKETIIHFDLKGAPPRPAYFIDLLTTVSHLGATGVIIEWEDMFPFSGELACIRNGNAYSVRDVVQILEHANSLSLKVIPLIQTLGHLEWVLKTKQFAQFREDPRYPQVACIGDERAQQLILEIVNQVLSLHNKYSMEFFHIGADEVFEIGVCEADKTKLAKKYGNDTRKLELDHIRLVAQNITGQYPGTKVLMWYDELKSTPSAVIREFHLDSLVTPVVWKYTKDLDKDLPLDMWRNLSQSFSSVWGGSAFKGADGGNAYWNKVKPYIQNNQQWFMQAFKYSEMFPDFHGVILTGWQRYDHFASLCELFPVSMTSLAVNIKIIQSYLILERDVVKMAEILKCPKGTNLDTMMEGRDECRFPGYKVRNAIRSFMQVKQFHENSTWVHNREAGWLQPSQMLVSASNTYTIDVIGGVYDRAITKLDRIIPTLRSALNELYFSDVAEEFLVDYVLPFYEDLKQRSASVHRIDSKSFFPPRPWFK